MGQHLLVWGLKDILVQKIRNLTCEQFGGQTQTDAILKKMHRVDPKDKSPPGMHCDPSHISSKIILVHHKSKL